MSISAKKLIHNPHSIETKNKISKSNTGKTHSIETKNKISETIKRKLKEDSTYIKRISDSVSRENTGKIWIYLENKSKFIKPDLLESFLDLGWNLGRAKFSRKPSNQIMQ